MNMPFITSSEAKNAYFMSGEVSRNTRLNKWHIRGKNLNFIFIIYNFKRGRYFCTK